VRLTDAVVFKFIFLSTWGDPFYVGLNGVEMRDASDRPVAIQSSGGGGQDGGGGVHPWGGTVRAKD
jgi:hypothetical protein